MTDEETIELCKMLLGDIYAAQYGPSDYPRELGEWPESAGNLLIERDQGTSVLIPETVIETRNVKGFLISFFDIGRLTKSTRRSATVDIT